MRIPVRSAGVRTPVRSALLRTQCYCKGGKAKRETAGTQEKDEERGKILFSLDPSRERAIRGSLGSLLGWFGLSPCLARSLGLSPPKASSVSPWSGRAVSAWSNQLPRLGVERGLYVRAPLLRARNQDVSSLPSPDVDL